MLTVIWKVMERTGKTKWRFRKTVTVEAEVTKRKREAE